MTRIRVITGPGGIAIDRQNEDEAYDIAEARRAASGFSPEQWSLQDAFQEGQRAAGFGHGSSMNRFQDGTPEYAEWERGRLSALGMAVNRPCQYVKGKVCDCGGRCTCVEAA